MIAQVVLSTLLLGIALYAWIEYRRAPSVGFFSMLAAFSGFYFVWVPAHATRLAEFMGIGRGVDLILYLWVAISFIILLNLHLKLRAQAEVITVLVRELAFANARFLDRPE
jgi:small membrane protein